MPVKNEQLYKERHALTLQTTFVIHIIDARLSFCMCILLLRLKGYSFSHDHVALDILAEMLTEGAKS